MPEDEAADSESDRRRPIIIILLCMMVILVAYGLFASFYPVMACPDCHGRPVGVRMVDGTVHRDLSQVDVVGALVIGKDKNGAAVRYPRSDVAEFLYCGRCNRHGKVSILRWIRWEPKPDP